MKTKTDVQEYLKRCALICDDSINLAKINLDYMKSNKFKPYKGLTKQDMINCLRFVINVRLFELSGNSVGRIRVDEGFNPCCYVKNLKKNKGELFVQDDDFQYHRFADGKKFLVGDFAFIDVNVL